MENPSRIPELFGALVFNDRVMKAKLPKDVYKSLKKTIEEDAPLEIDVANVVAQLCSDNFGYMTGQVLVLDGGLSL